MIAAASMCSGIGAPEVAAPEFDWLAACDISKFSRALFGQRFPSVEFHGDLAAIDLERSAYMGAEILIAGTPCQAFSIAGLRNSLADTRGNVTMQFVRVVHELAATGALRTVVWENVPGVLNTSDNAFGCFLGGIVGHDAPLDAPLGGWPNAGMVAGPLARLGWRVLDAQYFGLAQRRKRVFAVVDLGGGADPAAVLFERKGVRGHSAPSGEKRQDIAGFASSGPGGCIANPLGAKGDGYRNDLENDTLVTTWPVETAPTIGADFASKLGLDNQHINNGAGLFVPVAYAIQERAVSVTGSGPCGKGWNKETAFTLEARNKVQVVAMNLRGRDGGTVPEMDDKASLRAASGGSSRSYVVFDIAQITSAANRTRAEPGLPASTLAKQSRMHVAGSCCAGVRRLTPIECERLQGIPDDHTLIRFNGKPASDGSRYAAIGNAMAVPVMRWILERIEANVAKFRQ